MITKYFNKTCFFVVLPFVSMTSTVVSTLTTVTSSWLPFPVYHFTLLQKRLLSLISARATMVAFLLAYRSFNLQTSLFIDFRSFPNQRFSMESPHLVLKPLNKLLVPKLSANIKANSSHRSQSSPTIHFRLSLCLIIST